MLASTMAKIDGPIYLAVGKSKQLARVLLAMHAAAVGMLLLPSALPFRLAVISLVTLNGWRVLNYLARSRADDVIGLLLSSNEQWQLSFRNGRNERASLVCAPVVTEPLIALTLREADGRLRHVALLADNSQTDVCRQLRVRLRFAREPTT